MGNLRDEKYLKKLGKRVKQLRIEKGISTYQLSYDSDVPRSQISLIEKGGVNTTVSTLRAICTGLGVTMLELFDF
jgi:transcriptional regulator with XRE-family HTH domain